MSDSSSNAHASVTVTLEIYVGGGAWGGTTQVDQVHRQALAEVRNRLSEMCKPGSGIKIIGDLKVNMITHPMDGHLR